MTPNRLILLVEDNQDDIDLTLLSLKGHGFDPDIAVVKDGAEALDFIHGRGDYACRADSRLPELVLLDINLPKLSGIDVVRELRRDERTRIIPVVMLSTSCEREDVIASYAGGANSYLQKAVSFEEFNRTLKLLSCYWLSLNRGPSLEPFAA